MFITVYIGKMIEPKYISKIIISRFADDGIMSVSCEFNEEGRKVLEQSSAGLTRFTFYDNDSEKKAERAAVLFANETIEEYKIKQDKFGIIDWSKSTTTPLKRVACSSNNG